MPEFCHLHCHTSNSLLGAATRIDMLVQRARRSGTSVLGITDRGNLFGVRELNATARKNGMGRVIGCEFYVIPGSMNKCDTWVRYHQAFVGKKWELYTIAPPKARKVLRFMQLFENIFVHFGAQTKVQSDL